MTSSVTCGHVSNVCGGIKAVNPPLPAPGQASTERKLEHLFLLAPSADTVLHVFTTSPVSPAVPVSPFHHSGCRGSERVSLSRGETPAPPWCSLVFPFPLTLNSYRYLAVGASFQGFFCPPAIDLLSISVYFCSEITVRAHRRSPTSVHWPVSAARVSASAGILFSVSVFWPRDSLGDCSISGCVALHTRWSEPFSWGEEDLFFCF